MERILIVGAGIFGASVATELATTGLNVMLVDQRDDIMTQASYVNHNRLHLGYHYLRSQETAKQSLDGLLSFLLYYGESVSYNFQNYYAIAKEGSYTSTAEFIQFCDDVGIDYDEGFPDSNMLNRQMVESSFRVPEPVFDFKILKKLIKYRLNRSKVRFLNSTKCTGVSYKNDLYTVRLNNEVMEFDAVVNATYSQLNELNKGFDMPLKKIKYQDVFIPEFSFDTDPIGLTVMDGPFCSVMPKGVNPNEFLLYHVVDSVLKNELSFEAPNWSLNEPIDLNKIFNSSAVFYPFLKDVKKGKIKRTVRAVHDNSDDARVTELLTYQNFPNYFSILSGKVTTSMQVALEIKNIIQGKTNKIKKIL